MTPAESHSEPSGDDADRFARLFAQSQPEIQRYIRIFLPNPVDAQEVFQETCVVLLRKPTPLASQRDFTAWACRVARYEVLKHRKRQRRQHAVLDDEVLDSLFEEIEQMDELLERRLSALSQCLQKLSPKDRELIQRRYASNTTAKQVAEDLNRPLNTVYKALERVRTQLFECINRTLAGEEQTA